MLLESLIPNETLRELLTGFRFRSRLSPVSVSMFAIRVSHWSSSHCLLSGELDYALREIGVNGRGVCMILEKCKTLESLETRSAG